MTEGKTRRAIVRLLKQEGALDSAALARRLKLTPMAVRRDGDAFLFIENHCPICAAANVCQGFCSTELDLFKSVLGPDVAVERSEHIVSGDRRCVYRVTARPV